MGSDDWVKAEVEQLLRSGRAQHERGSVGVGTEIVHYEMSVVDVRHESRLHLPGNVIVVVPGHGQTVEGPRKLVAAAALLSKSKIALCIDPVPSRGGDRVEGMAIAEVTRQKLARLRDAAEEAQGAGELPASATLIGWSHGGSEALRAAGHDPALFPQYLGLCPTGLVDRHPLEMLSSFALEALRTLGRSLFGGDWACLGDTLRLGLNLAVGLVRDLWRGRSLRRLVEDVRWASHKVTGEAFGYTGEVVLLYGREDAVVRWRDTFPGCGHPGDLARCLPHLRRRHFPRAGRVEVAIVAGGHVGPETEAPTFLRKGLGLLGQLDEPPV